MSSFKRGITRLVVPLGYGVLTVAAFTFLSTPALAARERFFDEPFDQVYKLGSGGSFSLLNVNGSVQVSGWEREEVQVHAVKTAKGNPQDLARVRIEVQKGDGRIAVRTIYPPNEGVEVSVEYQIRVPHRILLERLETVNGNASISGPPWAWRRSRGQDYFGERGNPCGDGAPCCLADSNWNSWVGVAIVRRKAPEEYVSGMRRKSEKLGDNMKKAWYMMAAVVVIAPLAVVHDASGVPQEATMVITGKAQQEASAQAAEKVKKMAARLADSRIKLSRELADMEKVRAYELTDAMQEFEGRHAEQMARLEQELEQQAKAWKWTDDGQSVSIMADSDDGWLGVSIGEVSSEKAKEQKLSVERGVLVTEVEPDSPAAKAGMKANDIITEFNAQRIEGTVQFRRMVRETPPNRIVALNVWRDGKTVTLSVTLGSRNLLSDRGVHIFGPESREFRMAIPELKDFGFAFSNARTPTLGISGEELSGQLGQYFGAPNGEGVLVKEVMSGTPAEKSGMKAGDVITKIGGERVKTLSDLRSALREKNGDKSIPVTVVRKGSETTLSVEIEQPKKPERRAISRRIAT
ncbi:MAG: PDZ domain-containing protein [Acidobacteria bacterium]|nr:PDZ domain-containing protein [Acidobacteriota bacterium]